MKTKWKSLSLILLVVCLMLLIVACGTTPPPATTTAPSPTAKAPTQAAPTPTAEKPVVLKFSMYQPPAQLIISGIFKPWMEMVEKNSGGRLKFDFYPGAALGKAEEHYDMAIKRMADVVQFSQSLTPGRFPLTGAIELPFAGWKSGLAASQAMWKMRSYFAKEYGDTHLLMLATTGPHQLNMAKKPVRALEDLKGLRIRVIGGVFGTAMDLLGATPVTMAGPDIYTSMERGLLDGFIMAQGPATGMKLHEVMKYSVVIGIAPVTAGLTMNKATYDNLPADLKKVLDDSSDWLVTTYGRSNDEDDARAKGIFQKAGIEVITLPPQEMKKVQDKVAPIWDKWVSDIEAKGLPGKTVVNSVKQAVTEQK